MWTLAKISFKASVYGKGKNMERFYLRGKGDIDPLELVRIIIMGVHLEKRADLRQKLPRIPGQVLVVEHLYLLVRKKPEILLEVVGISPDLKCFEMSDVHGCSTRRGTTAGKLHAQIHVFPKTQAVVKIAGQLGNVKVVIGVEPVHRIAKYEQEPGLRDQCPYPPGNKGPMGEVAGRGLQEKLRLRFAVGEVLQILFHVIRMIPRIGIDEECSLFDR